ncbi:MAG: hypothetical protein ABL963_00145 [Longimicrobiales bacterium]
MIRSIFALTGALLVVSAAHANAQTNSAHIPIGYLADAFDGTPFLQGLLPTAAAEAAIAAQHVDLANAAGSSLGDVQLHMDHVLHAIDPVRMIEGPGLGYGVLLAVSTATAQLAVAAQDSTASDNLRTHAGHIAAILANAAVQTEQITMLAEQIRASSSAATASTLLARLTIHAETLTVGRDIDRDGLIGWQGSEGGLRQAVQHLTLLRRGEDLIP